LFTQDRTGDRLRTPFILPHIDALIANLKTSSDPEWVLTLD